MKIETNKKEKMVMDILDRFLFKEEIEDAYEIAMSKLMEVSKQELSTYKTDDVCNIIGNYVY